jgi:hypothetical protein
MNNVWNPIIEVSVRGEQVEVKELVWTDAMELFKRMTGLATGLLNEQGKIILNKDLILQMFAANEQLIVFLLKKSTGKDEAWINGLSALDFMKLMTAAVELNLREEIVSTGKGLGLAVTSRLGLTNLSVGSLIGSSQTDTPSQTSGN